MDGDGVSAEMAAVLDILRASPPPFADDVQEWRAISDAMLAGPLVDGTIERTGQLGARPCSWIRSATEPISERIVLYLHGGAYHVGSIAAYRRFASSLALLLDAEIAVIDYRLAPEHPFPAAADDALAAYRELSAAHDPRHIAVAGDSAGGGLTLALLLAIGREALDPPAAAVGMSAWTDLSIDGGASREELGSDPVITAELARTWAAGYLAGADSTNPLASPLLADDAGLAQLPPVLLQATTAEVLAGDSEAMGRRINAAGGDATVELWPGLFHAWHLADLPESHAALEHVRAFLNRHWDGD